VKNIPWTDDEVVVPHLSEIVKSFLNHGYEHTLKAKHVIL